MRESKLVQTTYCESGSVIHEFRMDGYPVFLLQGANDVQSNLINYGFTGPTFAFFPDRKLTREELELYAAETGLMALAGRNGVGVIFVDPKGETWAGEEPGAYEALVANLAIAQSNFRDGLAILRDEAIPDEVRYKILGSCVRMYVYGVGTGADYLSQNYLKPLKGDAVLGDLGRAEFTPVCCTLIRGTALPRPEKNDIHVVSVGNSEEYDWILAEACLAVTREETVDLARDFRQTVGNYRRWAGRILPAYNYEAEGIVDKAESVLLPISGDNEVFRRALIFSPDKKHKVGYVTFYDKGLNVKQGKVPLVLVFHGGGDSAYATASLAEWPEIGQKEGFLTVAVEMHLNVSAKEVALLIDHLMEEYSIDPQRIYATGFSMGSIKTWDLFEQCPERFAALMPMDAMDHVGNNCFGRRTETVNETVPVPLFYVGGQSSPLVELPFQHERAVERIGYVARVNRLRGGYPVAFGDRDAWEDPVFGKRGDRVETRRDEAYPDSEYTIHYYLSEDGRCYTALVGVTNHAHEIRPFTNRLAWDFAKRFRRTEEGIVIEEDPQD